MSRIVLVFASSETANANIAGIPAIARVAHKADSANEVLGRPYEIIIALPDHLMLHEWSLNEIRRLAPRLQHTIISTSGLKVLADDLLVAGEWALTADIMADGLTAQASSPLPVGVAKKFKTISDVYVDKGRAGLFCQLRHAEKHIMRSTAKPTDGIVSRLINRPVSSRISQLLLHYRSIRPIHATAATGLVALLMFGWLLSGSQLGLIGGALLFQAASMLDGVDGEIARATFRSSAFGATLDSLTDAATNLGFIIGLSINLWMLGFDHALKVGLSGFMCLGVGLLLLGRHAAAKGAPIHFDGLKHFLRRYPTRISDWLIWLTMRDFLALFGALMVLCGVGYYFLVLFALGTLIWVMCVVYLVFWAQR